MVAVGSKSIPEKQSISLSLSKNSEDKLEDDLFSEIFSTQSLTSEEIEDKKTKIDYNTQTNDLEKEIGNHKEVLLNSDVNQEVKNLSKDIFKTDENLDNNSIASINILEEIDYETGVSSELKNSLEDSNIDQNLDIIQLGILSSKLNPQKSEEATNNSKEGSVEDGKSEKNDGLYLNPVVSRLKPDEEKQDNKKTQTISDETEEIEVTDEFNVRLNNETSNKIKKSLFRNNLKLETSFSKTILEESNLKYSKDNLNEILINKTDFSKIKKEEILSKNTVFIDNKNLKISNLKTDTEKFFQTKYINSSNTYLPQSKNNLTNNQNNSSNLSIDLNNVSTTNNLNSGHSNNQNGTQSQSNINNLQTLNDIKDNLDMSDKKWASNLVSRLNKAHASKINELELVLTPKNLGRMKIKISLSDKIAFVKISTDSSAASTLIQEEQQKLNEMFKEVGLELEDFSSEQSFQQNFHDDKNQNKNYTKKTKADQLEETRREDNYIEDESILNIKV